jgi:uncharacterized membrane protein YesL
MTKNILMNRMYDFCVTVTRFFYFNCLWLLFTLAGGLVLGVFPATVALLSIVRKNLMNQDIGPAITFFYKKFKSEFIKANLLGYSAAAVGSFLYLDLNFIQSQEGLFFYALYILILILSVVFFLAVLVIFPLYVHYDQQLMQYFKTSLLLVLSKPFYAFLLLIVNTGIYFLFMQLPGIVPFFGAVIIAYLNISISLRFFQTLSMTTANR